MRLSIFISWTAILFSQTLSAQDLNTKWTSGIYFSSDQLRVGNTTVQAEVSIAKRTDGDIVMMGGNDYRVECPSGTLSKKQIKNEVFAVVKNDSLYINCAKHKLQPWYALGLTSRPFVAFSGAMSVDQVNLALMGGAIGGAIAAKQRYLYVFDLNRGTVRPLTVAYLTDLLREHGKQLLSQYENEPIKDLDNILMQYLSLLNNQ